MTSRALSDDLITLTLRGTAEGITATSTHPVYSEDRSAFVPVGSLAIGERVRTADGWALVETLTRERGDGRTVCNLEVEKDHTFLVGELGLVSHNDSASGGGRGCGDWGVRDRGRRLGARQGREEHEGWLKTHEFDPNQPRHVRGWLENERRRIAFGNGTPRTRVPPGYVLGHGRTTPAREGFDYGSSQLQGGDLNSLEELIRRMVGRG